MNIYYMNMSIFQNVQNLTVDLITLGDDPICMNKLNDLTYLCNNSINTCNNKVIIATCIFIVLLAISGVYDIWQRRKLKQQNQ